MSDHPLHCECLECSAPEPRYAGVRGAARGLAERLARRGVSFKVEGERLRFLPARAVEGEDLEELRRLKGEVIALIAEDDARKLRGEGNVRDVLEVFEMAREHLGNSRKKGVA